MHCIAPAMVRAKSAYLADGRLTIDHGDIIALIDERPDLRFIKGQNQRTFDIGTFPRNIVEPLKGSKMADISRPLNDSFRHTGHGSVLGNSWGNPSFLDPKYMGDDKNAVTLRGNFHFRFLFCTPAHVVSILFCRNINGKGS